MSQGTDSGFWRTMQHCAKTAFGLDVSHIKERSHIPDDGPCAFTAALQKVNDNEAITVIRRRKTIIEI